MGLTWPWLMPSIDFNNVLRGALKDKWLEYNERYNTVILQHENSWFVVGLKRFVLTISTENIYLLMKSNLFYVVLNK